LAPLPLTRKKEVRHPSAYLHINPSFLVKIRKNFTAIPTPVPEYYQRLDGAPTDLGTKKP